MNTESTQIELEKNSECKQNEPQLSKVKLRVVKESKVKVSKDNQTIRFFLDSHNLSSIDKRYEKILKNFFYENKKNEMDCLDYCDYVYRYLNQKHEVVDAKLFFTVSLKSDVLARFYNSKQKENERKSTSYDIWPVVCPVCGNFHFKNKPNGNCPLDMSKENSAETIKAARITFEKLQMETFKIVQSMKKLQTKGVN